MMFIQIGQEHPTPSEGHGVCVWGGTFTHTLLPVIDSLSFVTLSCPVTHPTPSAVTLPLGTGMHLWVLPLCINHFERCHSLQYVLKFHSYVCRSRWQLGRL